VLTEDREEESAEGVKRACIGVAAGREEGALLKIRREFWNVGSEMLKVERIGAIRLRSSAAVGVACKKYVGI
jgi:hypothetical protein